MPIPTETGQLAEQLIVEIAKKTGCETPDDIANVLEMLISKSARAIEKYNGKDRAKLACDRTSYQLSK